MNNFYEEPRHLNIKKVVILSIILILILIALIVLIARKISTPPKNVAPAPTPTSTVFKSDDNSISIKVPNSFNLKPYASQSDYLLELRSENNLNLFISQKDTLPNQTLSSIIEADKIAFLEHFESYSNLSETKELSVNNNLAYTYSFHYLDKTLSQAFYLQVTWLQIENTLYIFDLEFPLDDLPFNTNVASAVLSSFKVN